MLHASDVIKRNDADPMNQACSELRFSTSSPVISVMALPTLEEIVVLDYYKAEIQLCSSACILWMDYTALQIKASGISHRGRASTKSIGLSSEP